MMVLALLLFTQAGVANEPVLRGHFSREFKDKDPGKRIAALQILRALSEEPTLLMLLDALKDPVVEVRRAATVVIASCTDLTGAPTKGLCAALLNKKEDKEVRAGCANALTRACYKTEAVDALVQAISTIGEQDKDLFALGKQCCDTLTYLTSQDFGAGKETPDKWKKWWAENKKRFQHEDDAKRGSRLRAK